MFGFGNGLRLLGANSCLKELRIFGAAFGPNEVSGLCDAVRVGLIGLSLLEFSATAEAYPLSDRLIELAKERLYAGRGGLSVTVSQGRR